MAEPKNNGRKPDGTFAPGNSMGGRTPGSRNKTTVAIEALLEGEHEALTRAAIDKALEGDTAAIRLCLDRIAPARKDSPVTFALGGFVPWVQIIQNVDQTEGEAIAAYEAENGPVGDSDKILWVIIRKPEWAHV